MSRPRLLTYQVSRKQKFDVSARRRDRRGCSTIEEFATKTAPIFSDTFPFKNFQEEIDGRLARCAIESATKGCHGMKPQRSVRSDLQDGSESGNYTNLSYCDWVREMIPLHKVLPVDCCQMFYFRVTFPKFITVSTSPIIAEAMPPTNNHKVLFVGEPVKV